VACAQAQRQIAKQIVHAADHIPIISTLLFIGHPLAGLKQRRQTAADNPGEDPPEWKTE
jgi:hypothetical protein